VESDDLLRDLTPRQREAVVSAAQPLCILAAAGAGKTRVLTRRIAFRVATGTADPRHVLALTFTRRAGREMAGRLHRLLLDAETPPIEAGTFHALAYRQLRRYWADREEPPPALLERKSRVLAELAGDRPGLRHVPVAELAAEIEWARARLIGPADYGQACAEAGRPLPATPESLAALYARYEVEKQRRRLVDFDDLLARCVAALESDPVFAAAQRWRWRHFFVDEFQDINPLQHRLLLSWLGGRLDVCVVGDPNQSIYAWNGADPGLLSAVAARWPPAQLIRLDDNHRCTPEVVAAAAAVLGRDGADLRSCRPSGAPPVVRRYRSDAAEAHGVASELREARSNGLAWSQLAILFRTNAQAAAFVDALEGARIPYRLSGVELSGNADGGVEAGVSPGCRGDEESPDGVTLSTFHRAKGLQWRAVWVAGLERGLVPISHATTPPAVAEERRLLYVALTRAESELHCSWAEQRSLGGHPVPRDPSPWLDRLGGVARARDGLPRPGLTTPRSRLAVCRRPPRSGPGSPGLTDEDRALLDALHRWRASVARGAGVPPFVLFHDVTLRAVAAARPSTPAELLAVPGVGPVKAGRYGTALLTVLADHRKAG
jgi:DNA helicase-2/ATP-dependent DNA helicase PcrA